MAQSNGSVGVKLDFTTFHNVINGELCGSSTGKTRCGVNPATLEDNPPVPVSTLDDIEKAVQAARKAAPSWASKPWDERKKAIFAFVDAFEANIGDFMQMLTKEQGKVTPDAQMELGLTGQFVRGICEHTLPDEVMEENDQRKAIKRYVPFSVAVGIVPWNFPIFIAIIKAISSLITGCPLILKPSPYTPYCGLKLAELGQRFFPPGVLQALSGDDNLGPWLTSYPGIDMVSFTGSVAVGKKVMESCSKTLKRCVLELGGNDPAIVCSDVDIESTAAKIGFFSFTNCGQICAIPKRIYVHESIYDKFLAAIAGYATSLGSKQGEPAIGPVANRPQYERLQSMLADIEANKYTIAAGSTKPPTDRQGLYLTPTVVDNPPDNSRIVAEEPFGPVLPLLKWSDESDVIYRANNTDYGLGASVWSRNAAEAERIARQLQAGTVWVNAHAEMDPSFPFGGFKSSGIGEQYGVEGLKAYCNLQTMYIKLV